MKQLNFHTENNATGPYLTPYTKINLIWFVSLNLKARIKNLLEENRREDVCYLQIGGDFLGEYNE